MLIGFGKSLKIFSSHTFKTNFLHKRMHSIDTEKMYTTNIRCAESILCQILAFIPFQLKEKTIN